MNEYRLPNPDTRWVWQIEDERCRVLIEVEEVRFNGEEWWVRLATLPDGPARVFGEVTSPAVVHNTVDHFWENVVPVGGRVEDLSTKVDPHQYKKGLT